MPTLTPAELLEARRASGRMGGRPRKPTREEARAAALEELMPLSVKVIAEHLASSRPDSWRSAVKVLEWGWGKPAELPPEPPLDGDVDLRSLTDAELGALKRRLMRDAAAATAGAAGAG